jgi:Sulfotransferase family
MGMRFRRSTRRRSVIGQPESRRLIISVHLPKTAGTSFAAGLDTHFRRRFLRDYSDFPMNTPQPERNRAALQASLRNAESDFAHVECIHGHFLPIKYLLLVHQREVKFVTWLRHPVERLLSHFYHWKISYTPRSAPLHRRVVEEDWTIERFCLGPEVRNLYSQFLWGFPISYFDFIGITEFYEDDLAYFGQHYLGAYIQAKKLNVRKHSAYQIDRSFRNEIEAFHDRDIELYGNALEKRLSRCRI